MTKVIKRGGKKQNFSPIKIENSIRGAAKEAGISSSKVKELIEEVAEPVINFYRKKRIIKSVDLRKSILKRLEKRAKLVVSAWRRHEKKVKKYKFSFYF